MIRVRKNGLNRGDGLASMPLTLKHGSGNKAWLVTVLGLFATVRELRGKSLPHADRRKFLFIRADALFLRASAVVGGDLACTSPAT
jgi:hypothetical protein